MPTTTLTQLGNSNAVIVPSPILKETKWKRGQKLTVEFIDQANGVLIRPVTKKVPRSKTEKEFQSWLKNFLTEDAELLDKLA